MPTILLNLTNTGLMALRYGLIAWAILYGAGRGCAHGGNHGPIHPRTAYTTGGN